jgi:hypothetical protein
MKGDPDVRIAFFNSVNGFVSFSTADRTPDRHPSSPLSFQRVLATLAILSAAAHFHFRLPASKRFYSRHVL